jgi:LysR family transcriptional regulator, hydrogen peroxide-inducible genes activator
MTLSELRYLIALANCQHFGRAADECHVSQPTLSTQIRKLEEYLGCTLIQRNSRFATLTPIGEDVVEKARHIVAWADELLSSTRVPRGPLVGPLNLGVFPTLAPYFLPRFIPLVKKSYPHLQLVVHEDLTHHLVERLRSFRIDAALLTLPVDGKYFETAPLFDEPFWFACPPQHRLASSKFITDSDLHDEPLLLLADGHCLRGQALAACGRGAADEEEGNDDFRAASLETICQLVAAGFGCTLLPALAARSPRGPESLFVTRPLQSANASRRVGLVWRIGYPKERDLRSLADLVRANPPSGTIAVLA